MASTFISYGRQDDEPFVLKLQQDLGERGIDIWWDRKSMESRGRTFLQEIRDAIASCKRMILVVGPEAMRSDYVEAEWQAALEYCCVIVPILRLGEHSLLPPALANQHCPDFRAERRYDEALEELMRVLGTPIPPLGTLHNVSTLPAHFVSRPAELELLRDAVLADALRPTVIVSTDRTAALRGMGGVGKTVLATAFARSCQIRRAFGDGVIWLRVGPHVEILNALTFVGRCLGDDPDGSYPELGSAVARLARLSVDKSYLLVLDDVWRLDDVVPFTKFPGARCRLLLTTRDGGIVSSLGAQQLDLEVLSKADSLALLAGWAGMAPDDLPAIVDELVEECGRLPLALAMVGSLARVDVNRWEGALRRLRGAELEKISRDVPDYPYPNILRTIEVSVEALEPEVARRYLELAIFREGEQIPEETLALYWSSEGLDLDDSRDIIDLLVGRSLARRTPDGRLSLHDLQLDYVRRRVGDRTALNRRLVEAYRVRAGGAWAAGQDDGYYFRMLPYHLGEAGLADEYERLLLSPDWLEAKLRATSPSDLLADYHAAPESSPTHVLRLALDLSAPALARTPSQLRGQMWGRYTRDQRPAIMALAADCSDTVFAGALDGTIGVWNMATGRRMRMLDTRHKSVEDIKASADGKRLFTICGGQHVQVWDTATLAILAEFMFDAPVECLDVAPDGRRVLVGTSQEAGRLYRLCLEGV